MTKKIYNITIFILTTVFLYASSLGSLVKDCYNYPFIRNIFLFFLLFATIYKYKKIQFEFKSLINFFWYLFVTFAVISVTLNDFGYIFEIFKLYLVPIAYFGVLQLNKDYMRFATLAMVVSGLIVINYSLLVNPTVIGTLYAGVFTNSNTFGATMAVFTIASLCSLLFYKEQKYSKFFIITAIVGFFFECMSFCRTGILSCCVVFAIVGIHIYKETKHNLNNKIMILFAGIVLASLFYMYSSYVIEFISLRIFKWSYVSGTVSSSERIEMWNTVLNNISLFGKKPDFLPHNQFLGVTYYYGILAGISFILLHLVCLFKSISNFIKTKKVDSLVAGIWILTLCIVSTFEESLGFTGREWLIFGYVSIGYIDKHLTWV